METGKENNMKRDRDNYYAWCKENILRYQFTLNKTNNKLAMEHFQKQPNKREYLIRLIEEDAKKQG